MHGWATSLAALQWAAGGQDSVRTTQTPKAMGNPMAELLQGMQSDFYLPDLFGDTHCASCSNTGAHYHHTHADCCGYFLIPSFQATIKSFYATRQEWCLLARSSVYADMSLCIVQISFFFPFNKNLGWCRCGQHYIWWDNSTSHSSWKGLNKIGSSSQSSRYGKRSLLKTFCSQWQFKLEGWKQKRMYQWTCLMGGGKSDVKSKKAWISSENPALRCYTNHSSAPSNG